MMLSAEIARYLEAMEIGSFLESLPGGTIYLNNLPSTPDDALCIRETGGFAGNLKHGYDDPTVQITLRGVTQETVASRAQDVYDLLHGLRSMRLVEGGMWIVDCESIGGPPAFIRQDENRRYEYVLNFRLHIRNENLAWRQ